MRTIGQRTLGYVAVLLIGGGCSSAASTPSSWDEGDDGGRSSDAQPSGSSSGGAASSSGSSSSGGSSGGRGGGDEAGAAEIQAACLAAGQAVCARLQSCSSFLFQLREPDMATCASRYAMNCTTQATAPGSQTTVAFVQSCGAAMGAGACSDLFDGVPPAACTGIPGTLAVGAACGESTQCASLDCRKASGSYCGTCATAAAAGQSCSSTDCAPGLQCMSDHVCRALVAAGASCSATQHCQYPLVCKSGTCSLPDQAGTACVTTDATCDATQGLVCDGATKQCASVSVASPGATCGVVSNSAYVCGGGAICKFASSTSSTGSCIAPAADGASCNDSAGPWCEGPALCTSGACQVPNPNTCK
jgi:hypothetical protein